MSRKLLQSGSALVALILATGAGAFAQRKLPQQPRPYAQRAPVQRPPAGKANPNGNQNVPPQWNQRLQQMTPAQQEKFFSNNARFLSLPPQQQQQIRQRMQVWNNLTPEQRQALVQRGQVFSQMSPEQQSYVRQTLAPEWQSLPPARRQVLRQRLNDLRGLDDTQREAKLNDEGFMNGLNPNERQMLHDLSSLRVTPQGLNAQF
jgi:hypothetical protein